MTIIALTDSLSSCHSFWIRIGQYLEKISTKEKIIITDQISELESLKSMDKIIVYRHQEGWGDIGKIIRTAKEKNIRTITDIDDYLWFDGAQRGWTKKRLKLYKKAIEQSEFITCSNKVLHDQLKVMFKYQKIVVIPNSSPCVDKQVKRNNNKIRIGWTGAPWTRPQDLELIKSIGKWSKENKDLVEIIHIGHLDGYTTMAEVIGMEEEEIKKKPLMGHKEYLQNLDIDIGLAPLKQTCFNQFKSPIKVIEYSTFGIPWIASSTGPYKTICEEWQWDGRLCKDDNDWIRNIEELLNRTTREAEGNRLRKLCRIYSSFEIGVRNWEKVLNI